MSRQAKYIESNLDSCKKKVNGNLLLIVTATDTETNHLHENLKSIDETNAIYIIHQGSQTYYLGVFGKYIAIHVQCGMGSIGVSGSIMTVREAVNDWEPKLVLMVGIAFGVNSQKQRIGDVLVSEAIIPYNFKRVGENKTFQRSPSAPASNFLLNRFKNVRTWEYLLPRKKVSRIVIGQILSGEELIDNEDYRNQLLQDNLNAKGGEMEGAGIYAACADNYPWIIVKGICDFADGKKGTNKDKNQNTAIQAAVSLCLEVFSSGSAFLSLDLHPIHAKKEPAAVDSALVSKVLFDVYDGSKEQYYIVREIDHVFFNYLKHFNMWLHGPSGCGKSNSILRNSIKSKTHIIELNLANCIGRNSDDFFKEVLYELSNKLGSGSFCFNDEIQFQQISKQILSLLEANYSDQELLIFIDEIPIGEDEEYKIFIEKISSLIIYQSQNHKLKGVKYLLSSINSPIKHIPSFSNKIHEKVKFIQVNTWIEDDVKALINLITSSLNIHVSNEIFDLIIERASGSPRFIKNYFRNIHAISKYDDGTFKRCLVETARDLNF